MSNVNPTGFTPGPWRWEVNLRSKSVSLCGGTRRYDWDVLSCARWGMQGATVEFLSGVDGDTCRTITPAREFVAVVPGREHHASWFQAIDHPDAHLIAASPDLYKALDGLEKYLSEGGEPYCCCTNGGHEIQAPCPACVARTALAKARGKVVK